MIKKRQIKYNLKIEVEPDLLPRPPPQHLTILQFHWNLEHLMAPATASQSPAAPCKGFSIDENHIVSSLSEIILARLLLKDIESSTLLTFRHFEASEIAFHVSLSQGRREASPRELGGGFLNVGLPPAIILMGVLRIDEI